MKKIISFSLIGISIIFGGVFLRGALTPETIQTSNFQADVSSLSEPLSSLSGIYGESFQEAERRDNALNASEINATQEVASVLAEKLLSQNPNGPALLNGERVISGLDPEALIEELMTEAAGSFDYATFKPETLLFSFSVVSEDQISLQEHFNNLQALATSYTPLISLSGNSFTLDDVARIELASHEFIQELQSMNVPESVHSLHEEQIRLLVTQENIFRSFRRVNNDPFQTLLAFRAFPLLTEDFLTLSHDMTEFMTQHNISL